MRHAGDLDMTCRRQLHINTTCVLGIGERISNRNLTDI